MGKKPLRSMTTPRKQYFFSVDKNIVAAFGYLSPASPYKDIQEWTA